MQNVGVSWLSATMSASPLIISLIQTASSLPALLVSYLAGVTADRRDKRKLMIGVQSMLFVIVSILALLTWLNLLNIYLLILFTFLIGTCSAFSTPIWDSIMPEIISRENLQPAIAMEGVNFNLSRAIGPALGGIFLTVGGILSIFIFNALSALGPLFGLYGWKNKVTPAPVNSFTESTIEGLKAIRQNRPFLLLMVRTVSFTAFISTVFALLPQLSKYEWNQTSAQFTALWVSLGIGALLGSYLLPMIRSVLSPSRIIFFGCVLVAVCLILLSLSSSMIILDGILFIVGIGWISANATMNVLAQQLSPAPYKGRFLAMNVTVFQGSLALSSAGWGWLATQLTTITVLRIAAICMVAFSVLVMVLLPMPAATDTNATEVMAELPLQES